MASWRDSPRTAKFRGVEFFVDSVEVDGGRRGVTHEFPFRDKAFREDTGRKVRGFPVEGYVIGDNYFAKRNALWDALEKEGPGPLDHPYYGARTVAVTEFKIRETKKDGGMAVFSITFEETDAAGLQPTSVLDTVGTIDASATAANNAISAEFLRSYLPSFLNVSVGASLQSALAKIEKIADIVQMPTQAIATFKAQVTALKSGVDTLLNSPGDLINSVVDLFQTFTAFASSSAKPVHALEQVYTYYPGTRPPEITTNRRREALNFDAVQLLVQRAAVVQMARTAARSVYESYEAAVADRDAVADLIDEQMEVAADDAYPALAQLRADLAKAVPGESSDLPRLLTYTPPVNAPSLVLAHRLYGNVDSELSLVARNGIRYPGFVSGGTALEVLSDG